MTSRFALLRSTFALAIATGATLLIVAGSAAPVNAAEAAPSIAINTHGIDLTSPAGAARIEAEIGRAARSVCTVGDSRAPAAISARTICIKAAVAAARPQLNTLAANARDARTAVADAATTAQVRR